MDINTRYIQLVALIAFPAMLLSSAVFARQTSSGKIDQLERTRGYSFQMMLTDEDVESLSINVSPARTVGTSLGYATTSTQNIVPGIIVDKSYEDWQYSQSERGVDFRGTPDIHFTYVDLATPTLNAGERHGYNVYNPVGGNWPKGAEIGCEIGPLDERGRWPTMDVNSDGLIVIAGSTIIGGRFDNKFEFQSNTYSCFWGSGSRIPESLYTINMGNPANALSRPGVEYQEWAGDTVIHVVGNEHGKQDLTGTGKQERVIQHFRKSGKNSSGEWEGPQTIDSAYFRGTIASSRVSPKVAIFYTHITDLGYTLPTTSPGNNAVWIDRAIFYRESDSLGYSWNTPVEITPSDRTVPSWNPRFYVNGLYDSQDGLHIVWNARPQPANVYTDSLETFLFGDISSSLFHWSDRTGVISRIANADYGLEAGRTICGIQNGLYITYFSIGECDGNLYTTWSQVGDWYDVNNRGHQTIDDCSSDETITSRFNGNGDIYLSISSSLDGMLWDFQRNLTDTYTPDCDSSTSLGGNGECGHETKPALSRYGMDEAAMTSTYGSLTWPIETELDLSGNYSGNHFIHLFYLDDKFSGQAALVPAPNELQGPFTLNNLRWARMACVDPVTAPRISVSIAAIGYPEQVEHGTEKIIPVTVTNDGNTTLNISQIEIIEESGPAGWLSASKNSMIVNAGEMNSASFNFIINTGGVVNSPGSNVSLSGRVRIHSDAPSPGNQFDIVISNFIVGQVGALIWDTVSTGATRLIVSNHGSMGHKGSGGVNLDFSFSGSSTPDCNSTTSVDTYLYDSSPLIIQAIDSVNGIFSMSSNLYKDDLLRGSTFMPLTDKAISIHTSGPDNSDMFATGTFTTSDSTIAIERSYYAPTSGSPNDDFIIVKTIYYSNDGMSHSNLLIGEVIDWDVPSEDGSMNMAGIDGEIVYLQGIDLSEPPSDPNCPYTGRFSASAFLGMHNVSQLAGDSCANNAENWGTYAADNSIGNPATQGSPNGVIDSALAWQQGGEFNGEWSTVNGAADQRISQTYVFDYTLNADDTLTIYTALTTVMNGTITDLRENVSAACEWYNQFLRPGCSICGCCEGTTGNIDGDGGVDIADLTFLIDHLFINFPDLSCPAEGNIDGDGGIDIADLTFLIDHLFINFPDLSNCQ